MLCISQADPAVVLNDNNVVVISSNRLQEGTVPPLEQGMVVGQLVLADSLIIGNCNNQVSFSSSSFLMHSLFKGSGSDGLFQLEQRVGATQNLPLHQEWYWNSILINTEEKLTADQDG